MCIAYLKIVDLNPIIIFTYIKTQKELGILKLQNTINIIFFWAGSVHLIIFGVGSSDLSLKVSDQSTPLIEPNPETRTPRVLSGSGSDTQ